MESPFPPQLTLAPSNQASASASASAASPPGSACLSSDAAPSSSEPRQPRKRARTAVAEDEARERAFERAPSSDEGAAGQCETRAVLRPRGLYERSNGVRAGSARRVAKERAQQGSERLEWMRRSANDGDVCEPVDKRRRLVADSLGDAAEASHYDSTNGADRQTADFLRPPPLLPIPDCRNASTALDPLALHDAHSEALSKEVSPRSLARISLVPPITRATLRELDLGEIMRNPQLRHDVVFDPNLMFRPNYDGERGERKRTLAEQYWTAVACEVSTGCRCATYRDKELLPCVCLSTDACTLSPLATRLPSRIAPLVSELRDILVSLLPLPVSPTSSPSASPSFASAVPPSSPDPNSPSSQHASASYWTASRDEITAVLDPVALERQFLHGLVDVAALAHFLGRTLKTHCAPMRDELVDEMIRTCETHGVAQGVRMCFEILELMKLDIANHQLRSLRPYLVQTAVEVERRFFQEFVERRGGLGRFDRLRGWVCDAASAAPRTSSKVDATDRAVTHAILDLILPGDGAAKFCSLASLPETAQLDSYRLQAFHADAVDLTVLYMLVLLFQQLASHKRPSPAEVDSLRQELWCIMTASTRSTSSLVGPGAAIQGIPQGPPGHGIAKLASPSWRAAMQDVLLQVAARATEVRERQDDTKVAPPTQRPGMPSAEMLELVKSYFDTNVKASSKLFQLLHKRLRSTLESVVLEELDKERKRGPLAFATWWAPQVELVAMTTGHARRSNAVDVPSALSRSVSHSNPVARPQAGMMASTAPARRGIKRSHVEQDDPDSTSSGSEDEGADKRRRREPVEPPPKQSEVDIALQQNGLATLSGEVRLLGERIAKVVSFHLTVYRPLYNYWLSQPAPSAAAA
ncbi:hypothetical protein Rhopal_005850-T1 [Rhodotorula paludigena]|uniref:Uncharacterized protein n=1 Tax=Rhodotorula paludigena TaxID=86838 RepID=A0AAV5GUT9_9BASI|nr:hypothetical protein Rhopal_005850-T1 [Rhodotorula paludigena]